nr:DUF6710 family protein [Pseudomonas sp. PA15(2017)]
MKIVLRPIQALHLSDAYLKPAHAGIEELWWLDSMGLIGHIPTLSERIETYILKQCVREGTENEKISLASDMVLPTGWHPNSLIDTLGRIGKGLPCGEFKQSINHKVTSMPALCIGWVSGGNHSIAQAIIRGDGWLIPREVIDVLPLIPYVRFDGRKWRCIETGACVGEPRYEAFGWVWELARRIEHLKQSSNSS